MVLFVNLGPYTKAANALLVLATQTPFKPIGWIVGTSGLVAVQCAEIRPLLLHKPTKEAYLRANAIATIAYAIDCGLAIIFWPPLKVGLFEFVQAPLMSSVNWLNILIIGITLYGAESFIRLWRNLR
ncbi:MAG: hypothetical protein AAGA60_10845 [Cyanobacteria bacterium P01_E01_bin.42]